MFTESDHQALALATDLMEWASELVAEVMTRRTLDLNTQAMSFMLGARDHVTQAEREIAMGERYLGWIQQEGAA